MAATKAELEAENAELKQQLAQQGEQTTTTPVLDGAHVITAMSKILAAMSVPKGATLPQNMGGKPYITAVDLALEAKRQFVEHGLIFVPNEQRLEYQVFNDNGRKSVFIVIAGEYSLISTVDKSQLKISGIGDGIAQGSAVASNIASTNAMKNALLRAFMVTEQSAEDAAKTGIPDGEQAASQNPALAKAAQAGVRQPAPAPLATAEPPERAQIRSEFIDNPNSPYTTEQVNAIMDAVRADVEYRGDKLFPEVLRRLRAGEVVE